jgi:hypothetical protein
MSSPHPYLPGTFYEVTRRCVDRAYKLTPNYTRGGRYTSSIEQLYKYATACYAKTYDIDVIAVCIMANHIHEIVFDRSGRIAMFLQERNAMLARMVKVRYGLAGGVFERSCKKYNRLEGARPIATVRDGGPLSTDARPIAKGTHGATAKTKANTIAQKIAYVLANPVAAGLVAAPEEWPGYVSSIDDLRGTSVTVRRPLEYLDQDDAANPPEVSFTIAAPPEAIELFGSGAEMTRQAASHLERNVKSARRRHSGKFAGRLRVLATHPRDRAQSFERFGARAPEFTTAGDLATAKRIVAELLAFRKAHRRAREAAKGGRRRVTFPAGTGKMHFTYGYPREVYVPLPAA